ncbi:hypothetical protein TNIN_15991 [Trichonephila inaurata madagascariensis]|uniref:Uncharacterized protein n=1 Tax=Trichonephila inaurata madagascariensis TaxID=2747483 RepID=A0A8X7CE56_9ARAC|nr:hypothetical protein TNIN_15991 [Trichonephila inaurata madagascariensis]
MLSLRLTMAMKAISTILMQIYENSIRKRKDIFSPTRTSSTPPQASRSRFLSSSSSSSSAISLSSSSSSSSSRGSMNEHNVTNSNSDIQNLGENATFELNETNILTQNTTTNEETL